MRYKRLVNIRPTGIDNIITRTNVLAIVTYSQEPNYYKGTKILQSRFVTGICNIFVSQSHK